MCIDVERYPRTKVATAPSASQFVVRTEPKPGESSVQSSATIEADGAAEDGMGTIPGVSSLTSVKNNRAYQVDDDSVVGGKRDLDREELAKGYEYGRTVVPISESDENITKLDTHAGLELIGFVPKEKVCRVSSSFDRSLVMSLTRSDVV